MLITTTIEVGLPANDVLMVAWDVRDAIMGVGRGLSTITMGYRSLKVIVINVEELFAVEAALLKHVARDLLDVRMSAYNYDQEADGWLCVDRLEHELGELPLDRAPADVLERVRNLSGDAYIPLVDVVALVRAHVTDSIMTRKF